MRCGVCREEGHTRAKCPMVDNIMDLYVQRCYKMLLVIVNGYYEHKWTYTDEVRSSWNAVERSNHEVTLTPKVLESMEMYRDSSTALENVLTPVPSFIQSMPKHHLNIIIGKLNNPSFIIDKTLSDERKRSKVYFRLLSMADKYCINMSNQLDYLESSSLMYTQYVLNSINLASLYEKLSENALGLPGFVPVIKYFICADDRRNLLKKLPKTSLTKIKELDTKIRDKKEEFRTKESRVDSIEEEIRKLEKRIMEYRREQHEIRNSGPRIEQELKEINTMRDTYVKNGKKFINTIYLKIPKPPPVISFEPSKQDDHSVKECCICYEDISVTNMCKTDCGHELCVDCMMKISIELKRNNNMCVKRKCPYCRQNIRSLTGNVDVMNRAVIKHCQSISIRGINAIQKVSDHIGGGDITPYLETVYSGYITPSSPTSPPPDLIPYTN